MLKQRLALSENQYLHGKRRSDKRWSGQTQEGQTHS